MAKIKFDKYRLLELSAPIIRGLGKSSACVGKRSLRLQIQLLDLRAIGAELIQLHFELTRQTLYDAASGKRFLYSIYTRPASFALIANSHVIQRHALRVIY